MRSKLSAITAYSNTATTVGTTLNVAQSVLSQLDDSRNVVEQATGQQGAFSLNGNGQTSTQAAAASQLGEILSLLNTQVGNNYIFSGSAQTTPSVANSAEILNGNGAQAGLVQVINERAQADLGTGSGRLVVGGSGSNISLADDSATSPFGFKVSSIISNLTGATVTSSSPPSLAVNLGANPNAGDTIAFGLTLPDGSSQTITLQATTDSPPGANQFSIGANANATAGNLQTALSGAIASLAQTALPAASAIAAANDFFNSNPPLRVSGTPASSTSLVAGTSANTVFWYTGESGPTPARQTALAQVGSSTTIAYGMRANEQAIASLVANVAADGPAAKAGIKTGDLIVTVDGVEVEDPNAFDYRFATKPLGGTAKVGLVRQGKEIAASVALQSLPDTPRNEVQIKGQSPFLGATVATLSPALADELRLDPQTEGVVITAVADGSAAQSVGFQKGDIVVSVNSQKIVKSADLERVTNASSRQWRVTIQRGGQQISVTFSG